MFSTRFRATPIVISIVSLLPASIAAAWLMSVPVEVGAVEIDETASTEPEGADPMAMMACSCGSVTTAETWTVSQNGSGECTLSAPSNPVCAATQVTGGWQLACEYPYGAPDCAALRFTRPSGKPDLVGLVVSDPVCTATPAAPSTSSTVSASIQIPAHTEDPLRLTWDAWDEETDTCQVQILTSENDPT
jgi:hypothetical protein